MQRGEGLPAPSAGESSALPISSILAQAKASQRPCAWGLVLHGTVSPHPLPGSRHVFCRNQSEMSSRALPKGDGGISRGHTGCGRHTSRQSFLGTWQPEDKVGSRAQSRVQRKPPHCCAPLRKSLNLSEPQLPHSSIIDGSRHLGNITFSAPTKGRNCVIQKDSGHTLGLASMQTVGTVPSPDSVRTPTHS